MAPISVAIEEMVILSSRERLSTAGPYISTENPRREFAPNLLRRLSTMSFELTLSGIFPSKLILIDFGILNQTFPLCHVAAISISPIP